MGNNHALERRLLDTAARAAGLPHDCGFGSFRDTRPRAETWGTDSDVRKSLADARDTLLAALAAGHALVIEGDSEACADYQRWMSALTGLVAAWRALHTR